MKIKILLFLCLPFIFLSNAMANFNPPQRPTKLYVSAALFNARELRFNADFVKQLEGLGYQVTLPQRDGFDYKQLKNQINRYVDKKSLSPTASHLIYLLNMGLFIPNSDAIIALLDDPIDKGVIVEMTYAHLMGKKVIGVRTGDRMGFIKGNLMGGIHGFVGYQCDELILVNPSEFNTAQSTATLKHLAAKINQFVPTMQQGPVKQVNAQNPVISHIMSLAKQVIGDGKHIHSKAGLQRVVKSMVKNQSRIESALHTRSFII